MPPSVQRQMQPPPAQQFAGNFRPQEAPQQQFDPMALLNQMLTDVAGTLAKVAQVLQEVKPELMPILQKILQGGAMLQKEIVGSQGDAGQDPNLAPAQAQMPTAGGAGSVSLG